MIWCCAEIGARPGVPEPKVSNESAPRGPRLHAPSRARQDSVWGQRQRVNLNAPIPSAWVRWNYFCANKDDDSRPALRGTEDYMTYSNGLVWRRLTYSTLMADTPDGYSWQPIDFFAMAPSGTTWGDLFERDET